MTEDEALLELNTIKKNLQSDKNDGNSLNNLYYILESIVYDKPELADKVFEIVQIGLQSDKNDGYSLGQAYSALEEIVGAKPELADRVFETIQICLQSDKNDGNSLGKAYDALDEVVGAKQELADRVFETVQICLQSEKNDGYSLVCAYRALRNIVEAKPELATKILETVQICLQSENNYGNSLYNAYFTLSNIFKVKPELADKVLKAVQIGLQSDKNDDDTLKKAYDVIKNIIEVKPELADKGLEAVQIGLQSDKNDTESKMKAYAIIKDCMREKPLEEMIAKYPEIEQELRIVHNGRFASGREFYYALEHLDKEKLAAPESKIFRYQQADFSMLLEREAALNGISGSEICRYRHPDASERVKDFYQEQEGWIIPASFKTSQLFARKAQTKINPKAVSLSSYLDKAKKCGISPHDAVDLLPEPVNPEVNARVTGFIHHNLERVLKNRFNIVDLKIIVSHWDVVEQKLQSAEGRAKICRVNKQGQLTDNLDYTKVLSLCSSVKYVNQRDDDFAAEAANKKNHISASEYHKAEDIYLAGLKVPEPFDSKKEFKIGEYKARFLPRKDPRVVFLVTIPTVVNIMAELGMLALYLR